MDGGRSTMVSVNHDDVTCAVFRSITGADPGTLLRFVVGENVKPEVMSAPDIQAEFGDPFATLLLARGKFPRTGDELLAEIDDVVADDDLIGRKSQLSFLLGEGSQIPVGDVADSSRGLRFLVSRGSASHGPELIVSAADPRRGLVEVMAWDTKTGGFNFYRNVGASGEWAFAGNSRHALAAPTQGKGPFESHPSGNLLMKELKLPWVHWDSFKVGIFASAFDATDQRRTHPWFTEHMGAETCEQNVVIPSIRRWTSARFDQVIDDDGNVHDPARVVSQILTCATVNLTSSSRESSGAVEPIDLPPTFFVDADCFVLTGLDEPPSFTVLPDVYAASLTKFAFALRDHDGFDRPGDTHFAFVVPERAFEDVETLKQAISHGLISKRLAAALLMVDFANPVFSPRRAALLRHSPATAKITNGKSTFSDEFAQRIVDNSQQSAADSSEREFAKLWAIGDTWPTEFQKMQSTYFTEVQEQLASQAGFDDYTQLAETRRNTVRTMPIFEFPLLFAETNIAPVNRRMRLDGTVQTG